MAVREQLAGSSQAARRMLWGLSDQALSSATNFALTIVVARSATREEFGSFAIVIATYFVVVGLGQGLASQPFAVRHSTSIGVPFAEAARCVTGAALLLGITTGAVCVSISFVLGGFIRPQLLVLGLTLPGLLLQDAWRFVFVAARRPRQAILNDAIWGLIQGAGFVVIEVAHWRSPLALLAIWGLAGCTGAVIGIWQAGYLPAPRRSIDWLRQHQLLSTRYAAESVIIRGSVQLALVAIAAIAGLAAAGAVRGAQVVFSPLNLTFQGALFVAVPEGVRALRSSPVALVVLVRGISVLCASATIGWGLLVFFVPQAIGRQLLGPTWDTAQPLLWLILVQILAAAVSMGPQVGLKAIAAAGRSLVCHVLNAVLLVVGCCFGAWAADAKGAAAGVATATALGAVLWWWSLATAIHGSAHVTEDHVPAGRGVGE
jgi:O-antigen/teichoic acid export membrane protein